VSAPCLSTTGDDGRFYSSPWAPESNKKSVTTIIKEGVPKPMIYKHSKKSVAFAAINYLDLIYELRERANADN